MKLYIALLALLVAVFATETQSAPAERVHYYGCKVYRVTFENEEQFNFLLKLKNSSQFDFWQLCHAGKWADVMVRPHNKLDFLAIMEEEGFEYEVTIEDVEELINGSKVMDHVSYKGYKVYNVKFETEEQFKFLCKLKNESPEYDFWALTHVGRYAHIMVGPTHRSDLLAILDENDFKYEVMIDDVEEAINGQKTMDRCSYEGYKVYNVKIETEEQYQFLVSMKYESTNTYDFWALTHVGRYAHIMVGPPHRTGLLYTLDEHNFKYEVMIDDVEEYLNGKMM